MRMRRRSNSSHSFRSALSAPAVRGSWARANRNAGRAAAHARNRQRSGIARLNHHLLHLEQKVVCVASPRGGARKTLEELQQQENKVEQLKVQRKGQPRHLALKDLPEAERLSQLRTAKKHFVDTIKLLAYRAETALVALAREKLSRPEDARSLIRQILVCTLAEGSPAT